MLLNITPLRKYRTFRLLFMGQFVSGLGSMMSYVALPYQVYRLTRSSLAVGLIGVVQLVPILFSALMGGAYADSFNRRKILMATEIILAICAGLFYFNASLAQPKIWLIFVLAALASGVNGFHEPAERSLGPNLVDAGDLHLTSALGSFQMTIATIAGPALGGIIIASFGVSAVFVVDGLTFLFALSTLLLVGPIKAAGSSERPNLNTVKDGLRYAKTRPDLLGTYLVDFIAVVFGMPMALFPAAAENIGGAHVLGWMYSAPSVGALFVGLFSAWTARVRRQGACVIIAAIAWGIAIVGLGFSHTLWLSLVCLALAGAADEVSAIFRNMIWTTSVPDSMRGRLSGVQMISYMSGPLLGNAESGLAAALVGTQASIISGGILCVVGVALYSLKFRALWTYRPSSAPST